MDKPQKQPETEGPERLVSHGASRVELLSPQVLFFVTSDRKGALVNFIAGVLCFYLSITLLVWRLSKGELHPPSLIGGFVMLVVGIFFHGLGIRRYKQTGAYLIDVDKKNVYSKDLRFQSSMEDVKRVFFVTDPLEVFRINLFPEFPMWLTIEFKNGKRIRICKGRRVDLVPVLNWLVGAGLPYTAG